jgi:uncharacterized protein (TIGR00369 family)
MLLAPAITHIKRSFLMILTAADINAIIQQVMPASADHGFRVEAVNDQTVICRMLYADSQLRPGGTLSGPTMMALADAAMYAAVMARLGRLEMAVTQNININFLKRPLPADLLAHVDILKMGKRTVVLDVKIYSDGDADVVAHATGTYSLPPARKD